MKTSIGISTKNRQLIVVELIKILADENLLSLKTKHAHWNIEGPDFFEKHSFFELQIGQLDKLIDSIAERIRTLGHYAPATMKAYLELTHLTEKSKGKNDSQSFIKELLGDHDSIIIILREHCNLFADKYHDIGTSNFITDLMEKHEKMAWFLRSHLAN